MTDLKCSEAASTVGLRDRECPVCRVVHEFWWFDCWDYREAMDELIRLHIMEKEK